MNGNELRLELLRRTEKYARKADNLYDDACSAIAKLLVPIDIDPNEPFSFERYDLFQKVDEIMEKLEKDIQNVVESGIRNEFKTSYHNVDALIDEVVGVDKKERIVKRLSPKISAKVAAQTFINNTKSGNITASTRVWNGATLGQMECAVHDAIIEGMPASRMATNIKQFLNEPDNFFRRYRVKTGTDASGKSMYGRKWKKRITLADGSHKWKDADPNDYPTGQGVYHSSYRNALRYARTSTNIAYRTSDYERYQELPFVIGIEIKLSGTNHQVSDICDELQGKYPKDFKWTGWHPNCRCYQVPILAKQSEVDEMVDDILDGGDGTNVKCKGEVTDVPPQFNKWLKKNKARYTLSDSKGTLPYFIKDNSQYVIISSKSQAPAEWTTEDEISFAHVLELRQYTSSRSKEISNLYAQLDKAKSESDIMALSNEIRGKIIELTKQELASFGHVDGLSFVGVDRGKLIMPEMIYTENGIQRATEKIYRDMIIFEDEIGIRYLYPAGANPENLVSASFASKRLDTYHRFLKDNVDSVSILDFRNPQDPYWRVEYKSPNHISAATNSSNCRIWANIPKDNFDKVMIHECAHMFDHKSKISSSEWRDVINRDKTIYKLSGYPTKLSHPTKYARTNEMEDFAESVMTFFLERENMKEYWPSRYEYLLGLFNE
ncbi:MAG: hypothetical protein KBT28_10780 [Bacteroidales bacterium]|nr:hypothetical protein [Candidatus Colimorpha merdihippi]